MGQGLKTGIADNTMRKIDSDVFSKDIAYAVGQYCIYNNTLYKFIAEKLAGEWDESKVEKTSVVEELLLLQNKQSEVNSSLKQVKIYVGEDDKLHFIDSEGADSVLPFSKGGGTLSFSAWSTPMHRYSSASNGSGCTSHVALTISLNGEQIYSNSNTTTEHFTTGGSTYGYIARLSGELNV